MKRKHDTVLYIKKIRININKYMNTALLKDVKGGKVRKHVLNSK